MKAKKFRTIIFCNTIDSCRAVEYSLNEETHTINNKQFHSISYHGDLNSRDRETNLDKFRNGFINKELLIYFDVIYISGSEQYLVCTDIAARGLDIPEIGQIIMFDFPLNPIDYLHR
jgi:superfamily II DNA/RNA helicase